MKSFFLTPNQFIKQASDGLVAVQESRYGIPIKSAKELGLDDWFKNNVETSGMVWGGGLNGSSQDTPFSIVVNPYSKHMKDPAKREALYKNEAARILMTEAPVPQYEISPQLQKWRETTFKEGEPYRDDDDMFRETVVARILTGDVGPDKNNPMPYESKPKALAEAYNNMLSALDENNKSTTEIDNEPYKLYYFEDRNTGIAARSEEEARAKKKRGGDKLVAVRTPTESEVRLMELGKWVRTRYDGNPPGKSEVEGIGMGPPLKKKANKKNIPEHILKLILKKDTKALSELGKLGSKVKMELKKSKAITDAFNMQKHLEHPDTKHFLSWDDSTDFTKYSSFIEKSAVLGFKALTGNTGPIKAIIKEIKGRGIKINRVRPENIEANLPHTSHLPIDTSVAKLNKNILNVGKGKPRMYIQKTPTGYSYLEGIIGGTNPSPIASFLHEGGHFLHSGAVKNSPLAKRPDASWLTKDLGAHWVKGQGKHVNTVIDELGANNAALQALQQSGASRDAMNFYTVARKPSFYTYFSKIKDIDNPVSNKLKAIGQEGYTKGFKGLDQVYL